MKLSTIATIGAALLIAGSPLPAQSLHPVGKGEKNMLENGTMTLGVNYWESRSATQMWRKWSPETVEKDMKVLAEHGMNLLRVFPTWNDFQPIYEIHKAGRPSDIPYETRMFETEEFCPDTPAGYAGIDETMMERFEEFCNIAEKHGIKLIVCLLTGHMTARLFLPRALEGLNLYEDPIALKWEGRFIDYFVRRMKHHPAIIAWESGNETHCLGPVKNSAQAEFWLRYIHTAIRSADPSRPVIGVNGLNITAEENPWVSATTAKLSDYVSVHPYNMWSKAGIEEFNSLRNLTYCAAHNSGLEQVAGKPSFVEEHGLWRPMAVSLDRLAMYQRGLLWNLWASNGRGMLWWCAFDQDQLEETPYDWMAIERELGLVRSNREPKPALIALREFSRALDRLNLRTIPPFRRDAVVILSHEQDNWGVGYSSFLLAKQAGFDVEFATADQELPESKFYILPSVRGLRVIDRRRWLALLDKVEKGATLLVTSDGGTLQPFNAPFGVDIVWTAAPTEPVAVIGAGMELYCPVERLLKLSARDAEVLASDRDGTPVMTSRAYGKGKLLFLSVPIERHAANQPRAFLPGSESYYKIYQLAAAAAGVERSVTRTNPSLTLTEHRLARCELLVIAVNNTPDPITDAITAGAGWAFDRVLCGGRMEWGALTVPGNSAAVMVFRCNN